MPPTTSAAGTISSPATSRSPSRAEPHHGCPYDCGLCPDHEQHSCLALIEINEACNLTCPVCFADSSPRAAGATAAWRRSKRMMDALVESEGEPDLLQISGGEPTIHPQIIEILHLAQAQADPPLMLNTNGVRIASDRTFVDELAKLKPGFEVYLQFDFRRKRGAGESPRRRSAPCARARAGQSRGRRHLHHAGLRGEERRQR